MQTQVLSQDQIVIMKQTYKQEKGEHTTIEKWHRGSPSSPEKSGSKGRSATSPPTFSDDKLLSEFTSFPYTWTRGTVTRPRLHDTNGKAP